jgi:histidine triad (HIT) family protein
MSDCLFCKIIDREIPASVVYENDAVLAFLDINPVNPGHVLVVPKEHSATMVDASDTAVTALALAVKKLGPAVCAATVCDGWNLGVNNGAGAGQVVMHTHWHIMPRRPGDGHQLWHGKPYGEGEKEKVAAAIRAVLV